MSIHAKTNGSRTITQDQQRGAGSSPTLHALSAPSCTLPPFPLPKFGTFSILVLDMRTIMTAHWIIYLSTALKVNCRMQAIPFRSSRFQPHQESYYREYDLPSLNDVLPPDSPHLSGSRSSKCAKQRDHNASTHAAYSVALWLQARQLAAPPHVERHSTYRW